MSSYKNSKFKRKVPPFMFHMDSKTQPQFAFDCDINNIVRGMSQPLPTRAPLSPEITQTKKFSPDMYEQALYIKARAESEFNALPSDVRSFFKNDPKKLLEFIADPKNDKKCIELGLKVVNEDKAFKNAVIENLSKTEKADSQTSSVTPTESVGS